MRNTTLALLTSALVLCGSQMSLAGLIASDDFESYTSGSALAGGSAGTSWSGNWLANASAVATVAEHTISYPMPIDGVSYTGGDNAVKCTSPSTVVDNFVERAFTTQNDTVYFSVLIDRHYASASSDIYLQFSLADEQPADAFNIGSTVFWRSKTGARCEGSTSSDLTRVELSGDIGDTVFAVVKLSKSSGDTSDNYDTVDVFINPTSYTEPTTATISAAATGGKDMGISTVSSFVLREAYLTSDNYVYFDDIRVGTDFASVLPVPEPSTVMLLILGGLALCLVRRRDR